MFGDDGRGFSIHGGEAVAEGLLLRRALGAGCPAFHIIRQRFDDLLHVGPGFVPIEPRFSAHGAFDGPHRAA